MRFIRFGRKRIFHIFMLVLIGLFVTCPRHIYAQISIDRLLVSSDKPTDTVDGSNGKAWSVTESSYVLLGDTFYIGFDGIVIDSDCRIYMVITDSEGTEYESSGCSFKYDPEGLSAAFGLANDNIETFFGDRTENGALTVYGYHFTEISTTGPSGIYTGTLYVGDQQKSCSWYMVDTPIEIRSNPADVTVQTKDSATFYVEASGSNLSYQWFYNEQNSSVGGTKIKGADGPTYTVTNADSSLDGKYFYCVVSNYSNTEKYDIVTKHTSAARLTVNQLDPLVSAVESRTSYDGKSHSARVQVTGPDDYTIYYSTSSRLNQYNYMNGTTTVPSRTDVGTTTVYYYVHDNQDIYKDYAGTTYITILEDDSPPKDQEPAQQSSKQQEKKKTTARKPDINKKGYLISARSPKKGVLKLKWKKINKITGYQFFVSTDKSFASHTLKKEYKQKLTRVVIKKWPSKKIYYVKMRPYKKKNGKKLYGYWSKVKKVKIR